MEQNTGVGILVDLSVNEVHKPKPRSPDQREIEEHFRQIELSVRKARRESSSKRALAEEKARAEENLDDVTMIQEEKFDFDVPCLSLSSSEEPDDKSVDEAVVDEDEVFFGPVGYMEKVASRVVKETEPEVIEPEAPLTAAQCAELFVEAQKIASALKEKVDRTPLKRPVIPALDLPEISPLPRSGGRKRKGTFSLDDSFEKDSPQPKRHERKGTFTLDDEEPAEQPKVEIKKEVAKPFERATVGRRSLRAPAGTSGIGTGCGIRSLKLPPSPVLKGKSPRLKQSGSHSKLQSLKVTGGTKPSPRRKSCGTTPNSQSKLRSIRVPGATKTSPEQTTQPKIQTSRLSGGLQRPKATTGLQQPGTRRSLGLKAPSSLPSKPTIKTATAPTQSLQQPVQKPTSKIASQIGKLPQKSKLAAPSSSQPTSSIPSTQSAGVAKPSLKAPMTKLEMLRPNQMQRRSIPAKIPTGPRGPMKAMDRHSTVTDEEKSVRAPLKSHVNGTEVAEQRSSLKRPASPCRRSMETTPVKQEKRVQPKRLMEGLQTPPRKQSEGSNASDTPGSVKRKSFLPTPGRTFTGPRIKGSSTGSSVSSMDSLGSPQLRSGRSPVTRSMTSPFVRGTSPSLKTKGRPRVLHTPVNKENESQPKRSRWSPIQRNRPVNREDEIIQCTKRTALKYQ